MSNTTAPDFRASFIDRRISPFLRETHENMLETAGLKAHTRTLIVECRDGWAAEEARRRVSRGYVCGVDHSHAMIALARQYREVKGTLEFECWDREKLPLPDASFDVALVSFSIHRFPHPVRTFAELARTVKPSGKLLILESTRDGFLGLYTLLDWLYKRLDRRHICYYTSQELISMLEDNGFRRTRIRGRFSRFNWGGKLMAQAVLIEAQVAESGTPR